MGRHGSRLLNCNAASRPATLLSLSMCVNPRNSPRPQAICRVPSTRRWLIYHAGSGSSPPGDNRLWWFVKPIADPARRPRGYLPRASRMSPFFVAEQTSGIDKGSLSNSGCWRRKIERCITAEERCWLQLRNRRAAPSQTQLRFHMQEALAADEYEVLPDLNGQSVRKPSDRRDHHPIRRARQQSRDEAYG